MSLVVMFVSEALKVASTNPSLAATCLSNALACRKLNAFNRHEITLILQDIYAGKI